MKTLKIGVVAFAMATVAVGCSYFDGRENDCISAVSPDGRNEIRLLESPLRYEVRRDGALVVMPSPINLCVNGKSLARECGKPKLVDRSATGTLATPVYKKSSVDLTRCETFADFGDWGVALVARNDGVAYRFETKLPGRVTVNGERTGLVVPSAEAKCALNYSNQYGCEQTVPVSCKAGEIETGKDKARKFVYMPFVYSVGNVWVAVTESDLCDYPVWNLKRVPGGEGVAFDSDLAGWPVEQSHFAPGKSSKRKQVKSATGGRWIRVGRYGDYLVETEGTRTFPWRTFVLADAPSKFCEADIVTVLARAQAPYDFSWVKPGKVAWEWWNAWDNQGNDGCNTVTYKRFIDFAAKFGIEYVILDEGWSESLNIWKFHPKVDVPELIRYGKEKGVGIILWMTWAQVCGDEARVASHFAKLGAKGFKVDFMDRGDAYVERFLWKFSEECAKNRMLVDYHGVHRPTGMSRTYPNVVNYEGVHGLECTKWYKKNYDFMDNDIRQFFLRMTAGPLDYTPGAMDNYPVDKYEGTFVNPGSMGTRCRQMAMMALYEAPLQMLCDAPTKYERNSECFDFMSRTPVVWTDTVGLGGDPDSFAAVARRAKDGSWYAAAINSSQTRDFVLDTAFLGGGDWELEIFRDAADSDVKPTRYVHSFSQIKAGAKMQLKMARGGGFIVRFVKK